MADVSHELGALRFVVDSPLSSKVAMFNTHAKNHQQSQLLNPFSGSHERSVSPKPQIPRDQYGKPLAGSMTEMRGQKANMHVLREMLELCQIINSEGYDVKDEASMRVIPFGELFNIYNYISDKVVGILLRARKHKFVEFEGEMLFQRRDDDVPIFLLRPIQSIRAEIEAKIDDIKRASSPSAPQSTSVLMDKAAHAKKLADAGLVVPKGGSRAASKSRTPSPNTPTNTATATETMTAPVESKNSSKAASPAPPEVAPAAAAATETAINVAAAVEAKGESAVSVEAPVVEAHMTPEDEPLPATKEVTTEREEQIALANAVSEALAEPVVVVVEAPQTEQIVATEQTELAPTAPQATAASDDIEAGDINNNNNNEDNDINEDNTATVQELSATVAGELPTGALPVPTIAVSGADDVADIDADVAVDAVSVSNEVEIVTASAQIAVANTPDAATEAS